MVYIVYYFHRDCFKTIIFLLCLASSFLFLIEVQTQTSEETEKTLVPIQEAALENYLATFLDPEQIDTIEKKYLLSQLVERPEEAKYLPAHSPIQEEIQTYIQKTNNPDNQFMFESLYLLPRLDLDSAEHWLKIYNQSINFKTLAGIEYFSVRRQAYRILINEAYETELNNWSRPQLNYVPYDEVTELPEETVRYVYQDDTVFGKSVSSFRYHFDKEDDSLVIFTSNEDVLRIWLVEVISKNNLHSILWIKMIPGSQYYIVYHMIYATTIKFFDLEKKYGRSAFFRRNLAIYRWYYRSLYGKEASYLPKYE